MKKEKLIKLFISILSIICIISYILLPVESKFMVSALAEFAMATIEVSLCYSRIANEMGIESGNVRTYAIESLSFGMTSSEVEATLSKIAPVSILETYIVDSTQNTYISIRVHLCKNPFGDVVLDTYYSQDEGLVKVEDAWDD